jgi:hypothetical protein
MTNVLTDRSRIACGNPAQLPAVTRRAKAETISSKTPFVSVRRPFAGPMKIVYLSREFPDIPSATVRLRPPTFWAYD